MAAIPRVVVVGSGFAGLEALFLLRLHTTWSTSLLSWIGRLGKKMLGDVVPMRFHAGEPFHAGSAWQLMDIASRA